MPPTHTKGKINLCGISQNKAFSLKTNFVTLYNIVFNNNICINELVNKQKKTWV